MIRILFEYSPTAYLPEIRAYRQFLADRPGIETFDNREHHGIAVSEMDVVWRFMGLDRQRPDAFLVQEYNSLSTGFLPGVKNQLKKWLNVTPDQRVFLNMAVRDAFAFSDKVPGFLRDMGIDPLFFQPASDRHQASYDLVYVGSITPARKMESLLDHIASGTSGLTLLLVGEPDSDIGTRYGNNPWITFTGRVDQPDIPAICQKARFGLNWMPDIYPYNLQTSTKLLEYCAMGLPVVSSDYAWARTFAQAHQAEFVWLPADITALSADHLPIDAPPPPDVGALSWHNIIAQSGVMDFLSRM